MGLGMAEGVWNIWNELSFKVSSNPKQALILCLVLLENCDPLNPPGAAHPRAHPQLQVGSGSSQDLLMESKHE